LGSNGISDKFKNADTIIDNKLKTEGFSEYNQSRIEDHLAAYKTALKDSVGNNALTLSDKALANSLDQKKKELIQNAEQEEIASYKLENSYMGYMGKAIEPIVRPLGYDWKIGIAVLTSFAAREVFVGTLATIYSVGNDGEETIKNRMAAEIDPKTKKPLFNLASGVSLLLFYAFAMQCMSTLAIVKRETNTWKWPTMQLVFMSAFAYLVALIAYQLLK
jgi:ferrous iron transport protein B